MFKKNRSPEYGTNRPEQFDVRSGGDEPAPGVYKNVHEERGRGSQQSIASNCGGSIQAVRGMNDTLPTQTAIWQHVETTLARAAQSYGYHEIRFPLLEATALFARGVGESSDIVTKEMYTFLDRSGDSLTLRPEGTAGCVRACLQHGLLYNQTQRLWYLGPMFRHERPQKGRLRQFHQFGVEAFGFPGPDIDAEIILLTARFWKELGIQDKAVLHLNSLGSETTRAAYRSKLAAYFSSHKDALDEDSLRRLETNPLRILDSKNPAMQELIAAAPKLSDELDAESQQHFAGLRRILDAAHIPYEVNPKLVRGLDYYGFTVFEWLAHDLGAQNAICGGGRYNNLVAEFGGRSTPAIGFAIGLERLVELVQNNTARTAGADIYIAALGEPAAAQALLVAETCREQLPKIKVVCNCGGGNLGSQLKRADKSGAQLALILGDNELQSGSIIVKWLRDVNMRQEEIALAEIRTFLQNSLGQIT